MTVWNGLVTRRFADSKRNSNCSHHKQIGGTAHDMARGHVAHLPHHSFTSRYYLFRCAIPEDMKLKLASALLLVGGFLGTASAAPDGAGVAADTAVIPTTTTTSSPTSGHSSSYSSHSSSSSSHSSLMMGAALFGVAGTAALMASSGSAGGGEGGPSPMDVDEELGLSALYSQLAATERSIEGAESMATLAAAAVSAHESVERLEAEVEQLARELQRKAGDRCQAIVGGYSPPADDEEADDTSDFLSSINKAFIRIQQAGAYIRNNPHLAPKDKDGQPVFFVTDAPLVDGEHSYKVGPAQVASGERGTLERRITELLATNSDAKGGKHFIDRILNSIHHGLVAQHIEENHPEEAEMLHKLLDFYDEHADGDGATFKEIYEFVESLDLPDAANAREADKSAYVYYGKCCLEG